MTGRVSHLGTIFKNFTNSINFDESKWKKYEVNYFVLDLYYFYFPSYEKIIFSFCLYETFESFNYIYVTTSNLKVTELEVTP